MYLDLLPGGAIIPVTTTTVSIDVTPFRGMYVAIWSNDVDFFICAAPTPETNPPSLVIDPIPTDPSLTLLLPERVGKGARIERRIPKYTHILLAAVKGQGVVYMKPLGGGAFGGVSG